jgi:hypothetical protein
MRNAISHFERLRAEAMAALPTDIYSAYHQE